MAGTLCLSLTIPRWTLSPRAAEWRNSDIIGGSSRRTTLTGATPRQAIRVQRGTPAQALKFGRKVSVRCAGQPSDDFLAKGKNGENEKGESVAPRVTPDYVGKDSVKPPSRVAKGLEGPWITRWGGNVRGGKYQMGQGTDQIINIFANGNAMLIAAGALIVLFFILLQFRPDAPLPPPISYDSGSDADSSRN